MKKEEIFFAKLEFILLIVAGCLLLAVAALGLGM
jgi:hypothetical protein